MRPANLGSLLASQVEGCCSDNFGWYYYQVQQVLPRLKPKNLLTEEREHDENPVSHLG